MESLLPAGVSSSDVASALAPVNFEPFRDHYLTIATDAASPAASNFIQALILRALTSLPPGKTQITVIDPQGLGRNYGWLMHLGDYDPELVTHRVWTQPNHIAKHLTNLALKAKTLFSSRFATNTPQSSNTTKRLDRWPSRIGS